MSEPQVQTPPQASPAPSSASPAPSAPVSSPSPAPVQAGTPAEPAGAAPKTDAPAPPEGLDVRFWDAEKGAVKFDEFTAYAKELEGYKAAEAVRLAAVPEKPDGYKVEVPADLKLPEGVTIDTDESRPEWQAARQIAHDLKLDQTGFNSMVKAYVGMKAQEAAATAEAVQAEMSKLGSSGPARIDAVGSALTGMVGPQRAAALARSISSAEGLEGLEMLLRSVSGSGASPFSAMGREPAAKGISEEQYASMSPAERLAQARDQSAGRKT